MESLIAKKYAKALLELDGISIEEVLEQLESITSIVESNSEVKMFLNSPLIKNNKKFEALIEPIKDKLDKKIVALLEIMAQKGRLSLIPELYKILSKEIMISKNEFTGIIESKEKLEKELKKKLEKKLTLYSGSKVILKRKESDIDGVKVEVSDLGLELNFSKESVKEALIEHIAKAL